VFAVISDLVPQLLVPPGGALRRVGVAKLYYPAGGQVAEPDRSLRQIFEAEPRNAGNSALRMLWFMARPDCGQEIARDPGCLGPSCAEAVRLR
jgi:hypothetical protein